MPLSGNKVTTFTFRHQDQADKPGYASSAAFKQALDSQAAQLQTGLNGLIDALMNALAGTSGAEQIGAAPIAGVTGATIYAQLADLKTQLNQATTGSIPDGSLTTAKYADGSITTPKYQDGSVIGAKVAPNTLTFTNYDISTQTDLTGGMVYAYKNMGGF